MDFFIIGFDAVELAVFLEAILFFFHDCVVLLLVLCFSGWMNNVLIWLVCREKILMIKKLKCCNFDFKIGLMWSL